MNAMMGHFHLPTVRGSLRFVDTLQALGRDPRFAGIAKSIIDIRHSVNCRLTVKVTMAVDMNLRCKRTQLELKLVRAQDRVQEPGGSRHEAGHQINAG